MKRIWLAAIAASLTILSYVTTAPAHAAAGNGMATTRPAAERASSMLTQAVKYRRRHYYHRRHWRPRVYSYVVPRYSYRRHHRYYRPYRYNQRRHYRHNRRW